MNNFLIIGCGHMGSALLDLWSKNKLYKFTVVDPLKYSIIKGKFKHKRIQSIASVKQIKNTHIFISSFLVHLIIMFEKLSRLKRSILPKRVTKIHSVDFIL